ncbi:MAG: polysaccharide biosynthesis/export family protein [Xenococcaceae cyanobacterium]
MSFLFWLIEPCWLAATSFAQTSINLPKLEPANLKSPTSPDSGPPKNAAPVSPDSPESPVSPVSPTSPVLPPSSNSDEQFNQYRLAAGDGIAISVPSFPEFGGASVVDSEGNVSAPILGRIAVAGLTLKEVETKISYELNRRYLQELPEVNVNLNTLRPAEIAVLGEVARPGYYALTTGAPVFAALISAGGSTNNADLRSVLIRRTLIDGTLVEKKVDLYTPLLVGQKIPNLRLQGGDTIVVAKLEVGNTQNYDRSLVARSTLPRQAITIRVLSPAARGVAFRNLTLPNGSTFLDVLASLPPDDPLLVDDEVALMRFAPEKGGIASQKLNTKAAIDGDIAQDVPLQDEDTIVVSRTLLGKIFSAFDTITQPIRSVFGFREFFDAFGR